MVVKRSCAAEGKLWDDVGYPAFRMPISNTMCHQNKGTQEGSAINYMHCQGPSVGASHYLDLEVCTSQRLLDI